MRKLLNTAVLLLLLLGLTRYMEDPLFMVRCGLFRGLIIIKPGWWPTTIVD